MDLCHARGLTPINMHHVVTTRMHHDLAVVYQHCAFGKALCHLLTGNVGHLCPPPALDRCQPGSGAPTPLPYVCAVSFFFPPLPLYSHTSLPFPYPSFLSCI